MERERSVLVLGGGAAGLTVAEELARNGVKALLVEKQTRLGGHAVQWACMATDRCEKCCACVVADMKKRVLQNPLVDVCTGGVVEDVSFEDDGIRAEVIPAPRDKDVSGDHGVRFEGRLLRHPVVREVDAVFLATGFDLFPAEGKPLLGYGGVDGVITTADLDRVIREDRIDSLPADGKPEQRVAFLQCIGSRDREAGRGYCSQVCCKTSLRLAARLLHDRPAWAITIFHIDLQVFGKGFREFYRRLEGRVRFVQGVPSEVLPAEGGRAAVVFEEPETGELKTEDFDLLVLAIGMLPPKETSDLAGLLKVPLERRGFFQPTTGGNGTRIYTVGACRGPMDIPGTRRQAMEAVGQYLVRSGGRM